MQIISNLYFYVNNYLTGINCRFCPIRYRIARITAQRAPDTRLGLARITAVWAPRNPREILWQISGCKRPYSTSII